MTLYFNSVYIIYVYAFVLYPLLQYNNIIIYGLHNKWRAQAEMHAIYGSQIAKGNK